MHNALPDPVHQPLFVGHRGARGLSPENTLVSLETAFAIGVDAIELDVCMSSDGVVVLSHNASLEGFIARDPSGQWLQAPYPVIKNLSFEALQSYDVGRLQPGSDYAARFASQTPCDGARIPSLSAILDLFQVPGREHIEAHIEVKMAPHQAELYPELTPFVRAVLRVIEQAGMSSRTAVKSFDWRVLQLVQDMAPALPTAYLSTDIHCYSQLPESEQQFWTAGHDLQDFKGSVPAMIHALGGRIWSCDAQDIRPEWVASAHGLGLKVWTWTVNEPAEMRRVMDAGVDAIVTDYPDRLHALAQELGLRRPPSAPAHP